MWKAIISGLENRKLDESLIKEIEEYALKEPWTDLAVQQQPPFDKISVDLQTFFSAVIQPLVASRSDSLKIMDFIVVLGLLLPALDPMQFTTEYLESLLMPILDESQDAQIRASVCRTLSTLTHLQIDPQTHPEHHQKLLFSITRLVEACGRRTADLKSIDSRIAASAIVRTTNKVFCKALYNVKRLKHQSNTLSLDHIVYEFGMSQPLQFYAILDHLCYNPANRLQAFMLLKTFLILEDAPTFFLIDASLFDNIINSCLVDTEAAVFLTALSILAIMLPIVSTKCCPYYQKLLTIFLRAVLWEVYCPLMGDEPQSVTLEASHVLNSVSMGVIQRTIDNYFTMVYAMFPCSTLEYLRHLMKSPVLNISAIVKARSDASVLPAVVDPLQERRSQIAESSDVDEDYVVCERLKALIARHRIHMQVLYCSPEDEIKKPWFATKEASEIMIESMEMRVDLDAPRFDGNEESQEDDSLDAVTRQVLHLDSILNSQAANLSQSPTKTGSEHLQLVHYYLILNDCFFKECMRQYHVMYIRKIRKQAMENAVRYSSVENMSLRLKVKGNELNLVKQLVARQRNEFALVKDRYRKSEDELFKRLREVKDESRKLAEDLSGLTQRCNEFEQEKKKVGYELQLANKKLLFAEANAVIAKQDSEHLRQLEMLISDYEAKLLLLQTSDHNVNEKDSSYQNLQSQNYTLKTLLQSADSEIEALRQNALACNRNAGQLETQAREIDALKTAIKEKDAKIEHLRNVWVAQVKTQKESYEGLRKLNLHLQVCEFLWD